MELVTDTYRATQDFPKTETFGLQSQLRRAVISIPSNIAEGQLRDSQKEFCHHLSIAYGSLMETETQVQIASNLGTSRTLILTDSWTNVMRSGEY